MVNQRTLLLCPSCSCHARREERECPHCGSTLTREAGTATQRSVTAVAMGLALAVALPVAGCGDDTSGGGGAPFQVGSGSGDTLEVAATSAYGTSATTQPWTTSSDGVGGAAGTGGEGATGGGGTAGMGGGTTGTGGGDTCLDEPWSVDPACDECAQLACCPELEACFADPASCLEPGGGPDPDTAAGAALEACILGSCEVECTGGTGRCQAGITFSDPEVDTCWTRSCCVEAEACVDGGIQPCLDCANAYIEAGGAEEPGPACADFIGCTEAAGCFD